MTGRSVQTVARLDQVLAVLRHSGESMRAAQICARCQLGYVATADALRQLVADGLVEQIPSLLGTQWRAKPGRAVDDFVVLETVWNLPAAKR